MMSNLAGAFTLPRDAAIYTRSIFDRSRSLIAYNLWSGLPLHRLNAWIQNFKTEEEQYFAAKVLDALIYRPKAQTVALMQQLFQRTLPDLQRTKGLCNSLSTIYTNLQNDDEPNIRIVPVSPPDEAPIKSGAFVGRYARRSLGFKANWIVSPTHVPKLLKEKKNYYIYRRFSRNWRPIH